MRNAIDRTFVALTLLSTLIILAMIGLILGNIFVNGTERLSWKFITAAPEQGMMAGGIFPAIYGTVLLVLVMSVVAVPFGVLVAIYFAEYARAESKLYQWTRMAVNNLAGVPSIVFGLFGLGFFIQTIGRGMDRILYPGHLVYGQPSIIWASMTMAVLTLPIVIITVEEAMRAVPREYREASLALGAKTIADDLSGRSAQSWPGVMTGAILAIGRGAGEVAPSTVYRSRVFSSTASNTRQSAIHAPRVSRIRHVTQSPNIEETKPLLYSTVFVLLVLTFLLNLTAIIIRNRMRQWTRK